MFYKIFDNIWIQPAAGDAGGSLGAALAAWYLENNKTRYVENKKDSMKGSYLGPEYSDNLIEEHLTKAGAIFEKIDSSCSSSAIYLNPKS